MTLYREAQLDEVRYQHNAVYHANRVLVQKLAEIDVLVLVESCQHGVQVPHGLGHQVDGNEWCRGAAVGEETP